MNKYGRCFLCIRLLMGAIFNFLNTLSFFFDGKIGTFGPHCKLNEELFVSSLNKRKFNKN